MFKFVGLELPNHFIQAIVPLNARWSTSQVPWHDSDSCSCIPILLFGSPSYCFNCLCIYWECMLVVIWDDFIAFFVPTWNVWQLHHLPNFLEIIHRCTSKQTHWSLQHLWNNRDITHFATISIYPEKMKKLYFPKQFLILFLINWSLCCALAINFLCHILINNLNHFHQMVRSVACYFYLHTITTTFFLYYSIGHMLFQLCQISAEVLDLMAWPSWVGDDETKLSLSSRWSKRWRIRIGNESIPFFVQWDPLILDDIGKARTVLQEDGQITSIL